LFSPIVFFDGKEKKGSIVSALKISPSFAGMDGMSKGTKREGEGMKF